MKKILLLFLILSQTILPLTISAQSKDPAYVCIYRSNKFLCNPYEFDLQFRGVDIYSMRKNTAIEYMFVNEGKLKIEVKNWSPSWNATLWLNIESGKRYYVKVDCSISGLSLTYNTVNGENEWKEASSRGIISMIEDPNIPVLDITEAPKVITKVKTDTVKQIVYVNQAQADHSNHNKNESKKYSYKPTADVDFNIPVNSVKNDMTFALLIGNEDYTSFQTDVKSEVNVDFARNDANTFREYLVKTLGVPEKNITLLQDATYGQTKQAIAKLSLLAKATSGKARLIFYYAGHGMPDEVTKESYLMPVDISGANVTSGIKLKDVYTKLTENNPEKVVVFMDACFTGGGRNQGMVAARGVSIKPKEETLRGNIVVLSSSSDIQSSLPYKEKNHGMYTYYLLKKLQETKGNVELGVLADYLKEQVSLEAILINSKEQNPQAHSSIDVAEEWSKWKLK
jgi:hypothetical protein